MGSHPPVVVVGFHQELQEMIDEADRDGDGEVNEARKFAREYVPGTTHIAGWEIHHLKVYLLLRNVWVVHCYLTYFTKGYLRENYTPEN